jgi:hypothetical protein
MTVRWLILTLLWATTSGAQEPEPDPVLTPTPTEAPVAEEELPEYNPPSRFEWRRARAGGTAFYYDHGVVSPGLQFGMIPRYRVLGDALYVQMTFMGFYYLPVITGLDDFLANPFAAYKYGGPGFEVSSQLGFNVGAFFAEVGGGGQIQSPSIRVGFTALARGVVGVRFKKRLFGAMDH